MVLVARRPATFRRAQDLHHECGPYQLRAVLNAFDKDATPRELYYSPLHANYDISLPWLLPTILRRYGIHSHWHFWRKGAFKKRLLAAIERNEPVLFVIRSIHGLGRLHWISAWGYDESTDEFLCYDSQGPESDSLGPGNIRYTTKLLLSRLPFAGTFAVLVKN